MELAPTLSPERWAAQTFGAARLGDRRRTRRVVALAAALARQPDASLPAQLRDPAALKAAYRLLDAPALSHAALLAPHWRQTRRAAGARPLVLLVQDTTTLDYSHHPTTSGLGPIGNGRGRGFLVHSVLAVVPQPRQALGLAYQEPFVRQPVPQAQARAEDCARRQARPRESEVWARAVEAVGGVADPRRMTALHRPVRVPAPDGGSPPPGAGAVRRRGRDDLPRCPAAGPCRCRCRGRRRGSTRRPERRTAPRADRPAPARAARRRCRRRRAEPRR